MDYHSILYSCNRNIAFITLNRPHRLNAVTLELYGELQDAVQQSEENDAIRVIVLTGEGRAFCVGADLKEHQASKRTAEEKRTYAQAEQRICARIQESPKPFIAAVNGYALGAGAEMALSCDFVVMRETAEIGFPEISIGTYLGGGLTYMLPRQVGLSKAKELIFLGKRINGKEAERIGLAYKSVGEQDFLQTVETLAAELAAQAPRSLALAKAHLLAHSRLDVGTAMDLEVKALLACMETEDWAEGVRAFNEKRKPVFRGR